MTFRKVALLICLQTGEEAPSETPCCFKIRRRTNLKKYGVSKSYIVVTHFYIILYYIILYYIILYYIMLCYVMLCYIILYYIILYYIMLAAICLNHYIFIFSASKDEKSNLHLPKSFSVRWSIIRWLNRAAAQRYNIMCKTNSCVGSNK